MTVCLLPGKKKGGGRKRKGKRDSFNPFIHPEKGRGGRKEEERMKGGKEEGERKEGQFGTPSVSAPPLPEKGEKGKERGGGGANTDASKFRL